MRKVRGAAVVAAALVAAGSAHAMDYRMGVLARTGGWSPVSYRYADPTDEQIAGAHILEINGEPAGVVGDQQVLGSSFGAAYEDGLAFWSGGLACDKLTPIFQATSASGAFAFGARYSIKNKERSGFDGNGWSMWLDWKQLELKVGTTGGLGYGAYAGTGGNFYSACTALFAWEIARGVGSGPDYSPGSIENYNYFGYQVANAGLGVENASDRNTGVGLKWVQRVRGTDTLDVRLVNMFSFSSKGQGYKAGREYDTTYPVGWNVQANYRMPTWTFSTTFKIRGAEVDGSTDKYEMPEAFDLAWHIGLSTTRIPGVTVSAGYSTFGENLGKATLEVDEEEYDKEFWGHNVGLSLGWRLGEWSFNFDTTTSLVLLSDAMKATSNLNHYAWRPYLGETVSLTAHKRINGLMNGHIGVGFNDANMNSYTDGKAEAGVWLHPSVDISPARGVNVNVALHCAVDNFSDEARGWWSRYNGDADIYGAGSEVYYTYPHTVNVSIPITFSISI